MIFTGVSLCLSFNQVWSYFHFERDFAPFKKIVEQVAVTNFVYSFLNATALSDA